MSDNAIREAPSLPPEMMYCTHCTYISHLVPIIAFIEHIYLTGCILIALVVIAPSYIVIALLIFLHLL